MKRFFPAITTGEEVPFVLRMAWLSGDDDARDVHFDLTCGAGVGNPMLIMSVDHDKTTTREAIDIRDLATAWVEAIVADTNEYHEMTVDVFLDEDDQWRWHAQTLNGRIVAHGEAHTRRQDAVRAARTVFPHITPAIREQEGE